MDPTRPEFYISHFAAKICKWNVKMLGYGFAIFEKNASLPGRTSIENSFLHT